MTKHGDVNQHTEQTVPEWKNRRREKIGVLIITILLVLISFLYHEVFQKTKEANVVKPGVAKVVEPNTHTYTSPDGRVNVAVEELPKGLMKITVRHPGASTMIIDHKGDGVDISDSFEGIFRTYDTATMIHSTPIIGTVRQGPHNYKIFVVGSDKEGKVVEVFSIWYRVERPLNEKPFFGEQFATE